MLPGVSSAIDRENEPSGAHVRLKLGILTTAGSGGMRVLSSVQSGLGGFFLTGGINLVLYILLTAVFLYCLLRGIAPLTASRQALQRGVRSIRKGEKSKRSWRDEGFLGSQLQARWSAYLKTQFFLEEQFEASAKVEDYIGEDDICPPEAVALNESAPGIMMSLGFLGTLIGLWQGLPSASGTAEMLSAVRMALAPAIAGGALAVLYAIIHRATMSGAQGALAAFYGAMARHANTPQVDPSAQAALVAREQVERIQALADDVSDKLADRIAASMTNAIEPLTGEMERFTQAASREQVRGVDALVSRFVGLLDERMGGGMEKLSMTIDGLCRSHQMIQDDLKKAADGMARVSRDMGEAQRLSQDMIDKFDGYLTRLGGAQAMVEEGYSRISANVEHLEIVARQQNNYLLSVGKLQSEWSRALNAFQTAADQFAKVSTDNSLAASQAMSRAAEELKKSSEALTQSHQALSTGVTREIEKAYSSFFQGAGKTTDQLNWLMENIKTTLARLPDLLDDTAAIYAGQADRLTDALRSAQAALEDAVDHIGAYGGR